MKKNLLALLMLLVVLALWGKSPTEVIEKAFALENGDIKQAYKIMKQAKKDYPDNPDVLSVYGYMAGFEAKETNMFRALMLVNSAISAFDKALEIEKDHKNARLWRGILKINLPSFLGKVPDGIDDLEIILQREDLTLEENMQSKFFLAMGYNKTEQYEKAIAYYDEVIIINIDEVYVEQSKMRIERILSRE